MAQQALLRQKEQDAHRAALAAAKLPPISREINPEAELDELSDSKHVPGTVMAQILETNPHLNAPK